MLDVNDFEKPHGHKIIDFVDGPEAKATVKSFADMGPEAYAEILEWVNRPKFKLHTVIEHYKGGVYFVIGIPANNVLEETREQSYAYLIDENTVCHRSKKDMEVEGKFRAWTIEDFKEKSHKLGFIQEWLDKQIIAVNQISTALVGFAAYSTTSEKT